MFVEYINDNLCSAVSDRDIVLSLYPTYYAPPPHLHNMDVKGHTRFVCISDTFSKSSYLSKIVPEGDVLIHAGSFSNVGLPREVKTFNDFLGK